jgi:asparagine synthase (glutamine-hydrolysing)
MCGLNGIFAYQDDAPPVDEAELLRTRERMRQRGPDGAGVWISQDGRIGLAHRRLAIIDLSSAGAQPMATADGRYHININGEIYNYRQLKADLVQQGVRFRSGSDTEVLLHLYAREGTDMCRRLRGMYAFAIWDSREQSLYLARDPFGIKPLYVHDDGCTLRFASQVKALLAGGAVPREVSPEGEQGYWIWGHVPEPHTFYRDVFALAPGTWRVVQRGGRIRTGVFESVEALLAPVPGGAAQSTPDISGARLHEALLDSVRHHLVADVPVGILLSSGIDSSILVALAAECGTELRTLTLGFQEYRGTADDETVLAEQVARQYGAKHETVWISRSDFEAAFDSFMDAMDQPTIDGLNTWLISRAASQLGLKVALSGLGGDEFFGGDPSFTQLPHTRRLAKPLAAIPGLGRLLREVSAPVLRRFTSEKYAGLVEYGKSWQGAYLLRRAVRMPWEVTDDYGLAGREPPEGTPVHLIVSQLEATQYMRNQLLRDADWAGMAHSLELRVPLVDVELCRRVAQECRAGRIYRKPDLAAVARPPLPHAVTYRPKTGFSVPVRDWLMAQRPAAPERGVRAWQSRVLDEAGIARPAIARPRWVPPAHALWAPEMAAPGGVQNFMWRLWVMLLDPATRETPPSKGLSLNDSSAALAAWPNSTHSRPAGAAGSRVRFVAMALRRPGRARLVIVGHVNQAPVAWLARSLGLIEDYLVVLHGIEAWRRLHWAQRRALRRAKSVIATTNYTVRACTEANGLPSGNFKVIPLCAEPVPIQPDPSFRLDGEWPVLFVARLARSERYKGLDTLIEAVAQLKREGLAVKLHVVGEGDDRPRLQAFARQQELGEGEIRFHGRVDDPVLQAAYASARAFVMPSAKEGFGIVFLEAMRFGVPCIGGAHGGTPEVFDADREGLLVEYGEVGALASLLRRLAEDRTLSEHLGRAGQQRFISDYTFQRFAGHWREAVELAPRAPGTPALTPGTLVRAASTDTSTVCSGR